MKLHHSLRYPLLALVSTAAAIAQQANVKSADEQWLDVLKAVPPRQQPPGQVKKAAVELQRERDDRAAALRAAEKAARDFHTTNPSHPNAVDAKRMEVVFGLQGISDRDSAHEQAAQARATAFRRDQSNSILDRFEVALLSERVSARQKIKGELDMPSATEQEKIADKLKAEFGDYAGVYQFYLTIARSADRATARRIAAQLLQSPADPGSKQEAQSILAREEMVGKPLAVKLTSVDGKIIDLAQPSGAPRLIYVCSYGSGSTHSLSALGSFKKSIPANTQVIYLVLKATPAEAAGLIPLAPVAGAFCVDSASESEISAAQQLHVHRTPYVLVVSASGILEGFGPAGETARLVASNGR